jgi:tRNA dimethylallyltransferase
VVLSGPTASGKTALAVALAASFPFEAVSADSLQVYRGMDVGTGKATAGERALLPHHLLDAADPDEPYTAGRFVEEASAAIASIRSRGRLPLVVGGTGMYVRALLKGLDELPSDPEVRAGLALRWDREGGDALHAELSRLDPATAERVHRRDRVRVVRALEIAALTGEAPSRFRERWGAPREDRPFTRLLHLAIRWPREALRRRIDERVEAMFRSGLVEEVRSLLARGYGEDLKPMRSLGYRQAAEFLAGRCTLAEAVEGTKADTRRYAKRQLTWLAREEGVVWLPGEDPLPAAAAAVEAFLHSG